MTVPKRPTRDVSGERDRSVSCVCVLAVGSSFCCFYKTSHNTHTPALRTHCSFRASSALSKSNVLLHTHRCRLFMRAAWRPGHARCAHKGCCSAPARCCVGEPSSSDTHAPSSPDGPCTHSPSTAMPPNFFCRRRGAQAQMPRRLLYCCSVCLSLPKVSNLLAKLPCRCFIPTLRPVVGLHTSLPSPVVARLCAPASLEAKHLARLV